MIINPNIADILTFDVRLNNSVNIVLLSGINDTHIFSSEQIKCHNKSKLHWVAAIQTKCEVINPNITDILTSDVRLNNTVNIVLLSGINDTHIFSSEQMKCHNKSKLHWVADIQIKCEIINPNIKRHFDS